MMQNLWKQFPRLLVERINSLLDQAEPAGPKAYQLYKGCQSEGLWNGSFDDFAKNLSRYYAKPKTDRQKSYFDQFLTRPMDHFLFQSFSLNFRQALLPSGSVRDVASWAHNMMRISLKIDDEIISTDVLDHAIHDMTHPGPNDKDQNFEFEDFCFALKKVCFQIFGNKKEASLNHILKELAWLNRQMQKEDENLTSLALAGPSKRPGIYLTQTEIDWTIAVQEAVIRHEQVPHFPLSRGPQKAKLIDLDRAATLYNLLESTALPELLSQKDRIRSTVLEICEWLINEKAA